MTEIEFPEIPLFDRRRTRWAIVRGVARTALVALLVLVLVLLLVQVAGNGMMRALGRVDAMNRVGSVGYRVGHPGFDIHSSGTNAGALHVSEVLSGSTSDEVHVGVSLKMNVFGTLASPDRLLDPLDRTLEGPGLTPTEAKAFLAQLPSGVVVDAVVELARPLPTAELPAIGQRPGSLWTLLYTPPFNRDLTARRPTLREILARPVSWAPGYAVSYSDKNFGEQSFLQWATSLKSSDDDNLETLGLPSSEDLQDMARADLVSALYVRDLKPADLAAVLRNPAVRSFTPSAVRFALPAQASIN